MGNPCSSVLNKFWPCQTNKNVTIIIFSWYGMGFLCDNHHTKEGQMDRAKNEQTEILTYRAGINSIHFFNKLGDGQKGELTFLLLGI